MELRRNLRALKPDLAIDLQGNLKSTLIAFLSGCQKRIGYCEMREGSGFYTKAVFGPHCRGHVIERYRDVVRSLGAIPEELVFPLPDFSREAEAAKERLKILRIDKPLAVIFPGAGWSSKLWGADNYALLAQVLTYRGLKVAIGGSGADLEIARKVIELSKPLNLINLLGRTTLRELMGLTSQAAICIGADTGPIHVAAAVGTPTVTLFGPSSGERAGTLGPRAVNVSTTASCSPCFKKTCPKEFICMGMITPKAVYDACDKALGK